MQHVHVDCEAPSGLCAGCVPCVHTCAPPTHLAAHHRQRAGEGADADVHKDVGGAVLRRDVEDEEDYDQHRKRCVAQEGCIVWGGGGRGRGG